MAGETSKNTTTFFTRSTKEVDISQYPTKIESQDSGEITIGDLHGNAAMLLYILIRKGVLKTTEENFKEFRRIQSKLAKDLTKEDCEQVIKIINDAKINPNAKNVLIRLLGDCLADRVGNDYFMLLLLEKLQQEGVKTEILLSNHDAAFLRTYVVGKLEKLAEHIVYDGKPNDQFISVNNLLVLIRKEFVTLDKVKQIVEDYYLPKIKLISYTINHQPPAKPKIAIYTHAPVAFADIKTLAEQLGVNYKDSTVDELTATIDEINRGFHRKITEEDFYKNDFSLRNELSYAVSASLPNKSVIFIKFLWNRKIGSNDRIHSQPNYDVFYCHGHTGSGKVLKEEKGFVQNLDGDTGKLTVKNIEWCEGILPVCSCKSSETLKKENNLKPTPSGQSEESGCFSIINNLIESFSKFGFFCSLQAENRAKNEKESDKTKDAKKRLDTIVQVFMEKEWRLKGFWIFRGRRFTTCVADGNNKPKKIQKELPANAALIVDLYNEADTERMSWLEVEDRVKAILAREAKNDPAKSLFGSLRDTRTHEEYVAADKFIRGINDSASETYFNKMNATQKTRTSIRPA